MLRQLGRPLRLDRGHGLKDLLINTHPSSLLSLFLHTSPCFPLALQAALKLVKRWSVLQPQLLKRHLHYWPRLLSSLRGKGASHLYLSLSASCSVLPIFFCSFLPSLYFYMSYLVSFTSFFSSTLITFTSLYILLSPLHHSFISCCLFLPCVASLYFL